LFHVNVAWLVALATEEETPMAADAQNFWHLTGFYGDLDSTVTKSSSSSAGAPVRSNAGRTLAAIPKSVIQTSAGFITGIVALHLIEHHRALDGRLIAKSHVRVFVRNSK
jgi:hypothetical protein